MDEDRQDFIGLPGPGTPPQSGSRLRSILTADSARTRARGRRQRLVAVLGALGLPLWLAAVWPRLVPAEARSVASAAWALAFGAVLVALAYEAITSLRRAQWIATLGPLPVLRSARRPVAACPAHADEED